MLTRSYNVQAVLERPNTAFSLAAAKNSGGRLMPDRSADEAQCEL